MLAGERRSPSFPTATARKPSSSPRWPSAVIGQDPVRTEAIWRRLKSRAGGTAIGGGIASYAIAAIDIALWDLKGKALGRERARPARRPGARAAAGDRVVPRASTTRFRRWSRRRRNGSRPGSRA